MWKQLGDNKYKYRNSIDWDKQFMKLLHDNFKDKERIPNLFDPRWDHRAKPTMHDMKRKCERFRLHPNAITPMQQRNIDAVAGIERHIANGLSVSEAFERHLEWLRQPEQAWIPNANSARKASKLKRFAKAMQEDAS